MIQYYIGGLARVRKAGDLDISCIILAGGKSIRFGHDKILEKIGDKSLIEQVVSLIDPISRDIIVVTANDRAFTQLANHPKVKIVHDIVPGMGSLGGIFTGLTESKTHYNLVVAADMPFLNGALLRYMLSVAEGYDITIPHVNKWFEPLHAIYSRNCIEPARKLIEQGNRVIVELFNYVKVKFVEAEEIDRFDPQHTSFFNINTQEDMNKALKLIEGNRA
jgi:molybdopterin-guanine dinucleotide biosynthesis protein A